jgi:transposase
MRPQTGISTQAHERLGQLLKQARSKADFQRVQCMWLRAELGLKHQQVARAVGWSPSRVKRVWANYLNQGETALTGVGKGGRRRQNLTLEEERQLLAGFQEAAGRGGVLVAIDVKAAYEKRVGRPVAKSTIYRMLARHGWRKILPRPRHPKNDPEQADAFKKNSPKS